MSHYFENFRYFEDFQNIFLFLLASVSPERLEGYIYTTNKNLEIFICCIIIKLNFAQLSQGSETYQF